MEYFTPTRSRAKKFKKREGLFTIGLGKEN